MRSIARNGEHELEIQRSRFICSLARVADADQAAAFIAAAQATLVGHPQLLGVPGRPERGRATIQR